MKKFLFLVFIFCLFMLNAAGIFACTCELPFGNQSPKQQIKKAYEKSAAVFYGEVIEITQKTENYYVTVKFRVEKSWKNGLDDEVIIKTGEGGDDCGYRLEVGKRYLVYAYGEKMNFQTNICQRTSITDADSKYLDKIKRPKLVMRQ